MATERDALLFDISFAKTQEAKYHNEIRVKVARLRDIGTPWTAIARALGISRQGATKQFKDRG